MKLGIFNMPKQFMFCIYNLLLFELQIFFQVYHLSLNFTFDVHYYAKTF